MSHRMPTRPGNLLPDRSQPKWFWYLVAVIVVAIALAIGAVI